MPRRRNGVASTRKTLSAVLGQLKPSGWQGLEGLAITLLREATGQPLILAGSGLQGGLDAATSRRHDIQIAVECKRYAETRPLSARALRTEISIACESNPELDCWILVASREVTTQEDAALSAACDERGIAYMSLGSAPSVNVALFDALCGRYEASAVNYLQAVGTAAALVADFRDVVAEIKTRRQYEAACESLERALREADIGFGNFASRLNTRLLKDMADRVICKRRFRCALTPAALHAPVPPVRRDVLLRRLQESWVASQSADGSSGLLVLGEEGTGKSWVVSDWLGELAESDDAPAIFYVPAAEPKSNEAMRLLVAHAGQYALMRSIESAIERKLQRWLGGGRSAAGRRAIVVLDGINERPVADLWADLIEELGSVRMTSLHLVVTCRSLSWRDRFQSAIRGRFGTVTVGDFDETEFARNISALPPDQRQAIRSAGPLVRRPRYFHLAVQRVADLRHGEELTAELLYYWDWQHRESLRRDLPADGAEFSDIISRLARDERAGLQLDRSRLEAVLGAAKFVERQEELASSNIIEHTADGWRLRKEYFSLGLGMYLAARLEERGGSIEDRQTAADDLLGDTSALDLTTSVLQHALLHSILSNHRYDLRTQIALLSVWSNALNSTNSLGLALPQLQLAPALLLAFAEHHWQQDTTSHLMEQAVLAALVRVMKVAAHQGECQARLVRWAGMVHEHGESEHRADDRPRSFHTDTVRLCAGGEWVAPRSKLVLSRASQQVAVKLGRLSVAAVSACSVRQYWQVVATAFVADQAMNGPRTELLAWVIRWSHEPLDDLVDRTSTDLLDDADPVCLRAAQRLIQILGSQALLPRLTQISREHFPVSPSAAVDTEMDPCKAFFRAPTLAELPGCLARTDVPLHLKVSRARAFAADLEFPFPDSFGAQMAAALASIDASKLSLHMVQTEADHTLDLLQPLACRLALPAFANLVRRFARDCASRSGVPLRQASIVIEEFYALLDAPAVSCVRAAWEHVVQGAVEGSSEAVFAESMFAVALLAHMGAPEQLEFLRRRGRNARIADSMAAQFKQMPPEHQVGLQSWANDSDLLLLALWFLSAQNELEPITAARLIESALLSEESVDRGLALKVALRLSDVERRRLLRLHTRARGEQATPFERFFRTVAAVLDEEPDAATLRYVSPEFLGQALQVAPTGATSRWAAAFGGLLFETSKILLAEHESPCSSMDVDSGSTESPWLRIASPRSRSTGNAMFGAMSTWGGLPEGSFEQLFADEVHVADSSRNALEDALARAAASGNWFYGAYIPSASVAVVAAGIPNLADQFDRLFTTAADQGGLHKLQALVEAAIEWGFSEGHQAAFNWYDELESMELATRYIDRGTTLLRRHAALAKARPSLEAETRWRRLIHAQLNDRDMYHVLGALAISNGSWLLDEAARELATGSPRGRALALLYASSVDDPVAALTSLEAQICGKHESWYDALCEMSWQYVARARDQGQWLMEALLSDDSHARTRAAALVEYLGHPTLAREIERALASEEYSNVDRARIVQLPTRNGHTRERSEWSKNMGKRLLGNRVLDHSAAPWLPSAVTWGYSPRVR